MTVISTNKTVRKLLLGLTAIILPAISIGFAQGGFDYEEAPIKYSASVPNDPISRLQQKIDRGTVSLTWDNHTGYLVSLLQQLGISGSSQMLVFSKTSFQREYISPDRPRALYFNDQNYIGFVQGAPVLEIATVDPQLGAVFYVIEQDKNRKPKFIRQTHECLQCHDSNMAGGVPGHVMRSVYTRRDGQPEFRNGSFVTNDQSPFRERWGGWYVTGTHGSMRHLGNIMVSGADTPNTVDVDRGANVTDLHKLIDTHPYINKYADIVALMVSEHQIKLLNLITRANFQTRMALDYEKKLKLELGYNAQTRLDSVNARIQGASESLVQALLMCKEERLTADVKGTSGFTETFASHGPRDSKGRSLRDFDLRSRLFMYPCSYMIYSDAFDGLPAESREYVFLRINQILNGSDKSDTFSHLSPEDRKAIFEILKDTKPSFAAWLKLHDKA